MLVPAVGLLLAARFCETGEWSSVTITGFLGIWFLGIYAFNPRLRRIFRRWNQSPRPILVVAATAIAWTWFTQGPGSLSPWRWLGALACAAAGSVAQRGFVRQARRVRASTAEALRWLAVAAVCAWVIHPYATRSLVGGGDAHHYAQQLADAAAQLRQGEFQLFVGQSAFAFNGDIHPLRTAPYFSYVGAVVSLLAGPDFPPTAVQNGMIVFSLCGAVALLYLLLTRLRPRAAWLAFWLSVAFAGCPGVLALIYSGDMVSSWLTLPWLPVVFYAAIRTWETPNPIAGPSCLLAASLAILWLVHAPVAFWTSTLVALPLVARIIVRWEGGRGLWTAIAIATTCFALCGYVFVSVDSLEIPTDPNLVKFVREGGVLEILRTGWSGFFRPLEPTGSDLLRNLQLSPALWLAAAIGLAAVKRHRWSAGPLLCGVLGMLLLLYPSTLAGGLWAVMPASVISATDKWPMQRFYLILSVTIPFLAVLAWPINSATRGPKILRTLLLSGLAATTLFSLYDARKLMARGRAVTSSPEMSARRLRPENVVLSRYSYEYYGRLPRVFSHGTVSPWMQNRLLERDTLAPIDSNLIALGPDSSQGVVESRTQHRFQPTDYGGIYTPALRLEPDHTYFVRFLFGDEPAHGTLQLLGRNIYREYCLPMSGESQAFGSTETNREGFSLWTTAPTPDDVEIRFYAQPGRAPTKNLGDVELIAVNRAALPLRLQSVDPFRISVTHSAPAWLETPKLFLPGYVASVDGVSVQPQRSPDGLVMIPLPVGQHQVNLGYVGPPALRVAYWGTLSAWFLFFGFLVWNALQPQAVTAAFLNFGRIAAVFGLIGIVLFGSSSVYARFRTDPPPSLAQKPVELRFRLPSGLEKKREELWSFQHAGSTWTVSCFYENGQSLRLGLSQKGRLVAQSEAFQVNYLRDHRLIASISPAVENHPAQLRIWVNQRLIITFPFRDDAEGQDGPADRFGGEILTIGPSAGPALTAR